MMKYLIASKLDAQLDKDAAFMSKWIEGKFTASERRVLITKWVGEAWDEFRQQPYIYKYFEKTGCLLCTVKADPTKISIQGVKDYQYQSSNNSFVIQLDSQDDSTETCSSSDWRGFSGSDDDQDPFDMKDQPEKVSSPMNGVGTQPQLVFKEDDVVQVLNSDLTIVAQGRIKAPRTTLHGKILPPNFVVVIIQQIQSGLTLGSDGFGEPIGAGGYFAVHPDWIRLLETGNNC
jgi:hypothetical protein